MVAPTDACRPLIKNDQQAPQAPVLVPKWMDKLPGNRKGRRKPSSRLVNGNGITKAKGKDVGRKEEGRRLASRDSVRGFLGGRLVVG